MPYVVELLPTMCKALGSIPCTKTTKQKKTKKTKKKPTNFNPQSEKKKKNKIHIFHQGLDHTI
jgi:hypothetical protein